EEVAGDRRFGVRYPGRSPELGLGERTMTVAAAASQVIPLARAIRDYWEAELPKRHPRYPIVDPGTDSGPPPPEEKQLRQLLAQLPEDTVYKLALMMYLGRGDFDTSDLAGEYQAIRDNFDT